MISLQLLRSYWMLAKEQSMHLKAWAKGLTSYSSMLWPDRCVLKPSPQTVCAVALGCFFIHAKVVIAKELLQVPLIQTSWHAYHLRSLLSRCNTCKQSSTALACWATRKASWKNRVNGADCGRESKVASCWFGANVRFLPDGRALEGWTSPQHKLHAASSERVLELVPSAWFSQSCKRWPCHWRGGTVGPGVWDPHGGDAVGVCKGSRVGSFQVCALFKPAHTWSLLISFILKCSFWNLPISDRFGLGNDKRASKNVCK